MKLLEVMRLHLKARHAEFSGQTAAPPDITALFQPPPPIILNAKETSQIADLGCWVFISARPAFCQSTSPVALARAVNLLKQRPAVAHRVIRPASAPQRDRWQRPGAKEASRRRSQHQGGGKKNEMERRWESDSHLWSPKKCWCCFFILCVRGGSIDR